MFANLAGKVALVTGSTSGIGLGVATQLASKGVHVALNGFGTTEEINKIRQNIESQYRVKTFYHGADLKDQKQIKDLVEQTASKLGPVSILINNAGIQHVDTITNFPEQVFNDVIAINLTAAFLSTKYALPSMLSQNWGRIINVASVHGLVASVNKSAYVSAKHGIIGLTKATALETAKTKVTCNAICPGWVMTKLIEKQIQIIADRDQIPFAQAQRKLLEEKQPSVAAATPEQIGDLACFLCTESAQEIRGASLTMDGGWTAQ